MHDHTHHLTTPSPPSASIGGLPNTCPTCDRAYAPETVVFTVPATTAGQTKFSLLPPTPPPRNRHERRAHEARSRRRP